MPTNPGRILIVDDNQVNRMLLTRALTEQGHQPTTAENGKQALELLRAKNDDQLCAFDVVLLDILMPELDGFQVLEQMKNDAALRDLPVVVISALEEMDSAIRCIEMGAEDYLPKPFNPVLLRARIGASLEKKRLRDQEHLYLKAVERELEIGREIQTSFLPAELPRLPGWEIAARFQPARQVGGDFYDAFLLDNQQIGLVIADVCDKGVGAALFMALFRSLIRALATQNSSKRKSRASTLANLQNTIARTNQYIAVTHSQANMFATLFFGILDPATGALLYINAGHEPPVILNRAGVKTSLSRTGIPVGIMPAVKFRIDATRLEPGDTLFAFTDGIVDALDARDEMFGRERLANLLAQPASSASLLLERAQTRVRAHIADAQQFDDITMLAVRRRARSPKSKR